MLADYAMRTVLSSINVVTAFLNVLILRIYYFKEVIHMTDTAMPLLLKILELLEKGFL
ncbi:hypothetical protein [Staphylococcus succinus]|nr:hypothetical protein [Staphylococcus succinus]MBU0438490.1 hypothetical protein [Staphylococcus succinus]MEB7462732.1 hypothetical protein [Staphylococcus succinus]MEB8123583.1 hypothetical protein [Staphylococcus succinus]